MKRKHNSPNFIIQSFTLSWEPNTYNCYPKIFNLKSQCRKEVLMWRHTYLQHAFPAGSVHQTTHRQCSLRHCSTLSETVANQVTTVSYSLDSNVAHPLMTIRVPWISSTSCCTEHPLWYMDPKTQHNSTQHMSIMSLSSKHTTNLHMSINETELLR